MIKFLFALFIAVFAFPKAGITEQRFALVIGNAAYENVEPLENPRNDATDLAAALTRMGFEVDLGLDLDRVGLTKAIERFTSEAKGADLSLIYFAGHGIELDQTNFLIPTDARLKYDTDAEAETVTLDAIMSQIADMRGIKVVLIDACRNNPFAERLRQSQPTRSIGIGLVRVDPLGGVLPDGILIGYAAKEGTVAFEGTSRNSPYAAGLLQHIEEPGLEIGKLFRRVRDSVFAATGGAQQPFTYGSLPSEDIFLVPAVAGPDSKASSNLEAITRLSDAFVRAEKLNTIINWERFLSEYAEVYPGNQLVRSARQKLEALQETVRRSQSVVWLDATYDASGAAVLNREQTRLLQASLQYSGFDPGTPDGVVGPRTRRAIAAARLHYGLPFGEAVDEPLLKRLIDPLPVLELMSDTSRQYSARSLSAVLEPRLKRVIELLPRYHYIFDYFEGRLYVAVRNDNSSPGLKLTWEMANQLAQAAGGHLATITSASENDFIYELFSRDPKFTVERDGNIHGPGFGLFQIDRSAEPRGGWTWVNGEVASFTNWAPGQPNNVGGKEHYGEFFGPGRQRTGRSGPRFWNDATLGVGRNATHTEFSGFIFEVD